MRLGLVLALLTVLVFFTGIASGQELDLPPGVEAIQEYNQRYAQEFLQTVSIPLVFLAGILSIISPCILPLIPAFFSYTFKEKKKITKMTLTFFVGFSMIFVIMGMIAGYLGESLTVLRGDITYLVAIAGIGLVFFGLLAFLGRGFSSFIKVNRKTESDFIGVFLMGIFFAIGWSACLGPIIGGILLIVGLLGSVAYGALLLFVYSLGIMAPLLIISLFYDRLNLENNRFIKGREVRFRIAGKKIITHTTEMLSGFLLIGLGLFFIVFGGTAIVNTLSPIGSSVLFNQLQHTLIETPMIGNIIGAALLIIVVLLLVKFSRSRKK
jgi:cytochrome c-type biogenesis protein